MTDKASGRKLPLNLFDIIIIVLVIALAAGFIFVRLQGSKSADSGSSGTVEYSIELSTIAENTEGMIIKKLYMGTVKSVEFYPATKEATDYTTGNTVYTEVPGMISARVELTADCKETDTAITVNGGYVVRIGTEVSVLGPGYSGSGYVLGVKRGEAKGAGLLTKTGDYSEK